MKFLTLALITLFSASVMAESLTAEIVFLPGGKIPVTAPNQEDDYEFCPKKNFVITLQKPIKKAIIESHNYTAHISNDNKTFVLIYNPSLKKKDKYLPRVEIKTTDGSLVTLREGDCDLFRVADLTR